MPCASHVKTAIPISLSAQSRQTPSTRYVLRRLSMLFSSQLRRVGHDLTHAPLRSQRR